MVLVMLGIWCSGRERAQAQSWSSTNLFGDWTSLVVSADGSKMAAAAYLGGIYTSTNGGTNWMGAGLLESGRPVLAASANGSVLAAAFDEGNIYTSSNWGANSNWIESGAPVNEWNCLAASGDGSKFVAGTFPGLIYSSTNGGGTWGELSAPWDFWQSIASSASGANLLAASHFGYVYSSTNAGATWNELAIALGGTNVIASDTLDISVIYTNSNPTATDTNAFITNLFNPILTIPAVAVSTTNLSATDGLGIDLLNASGTNFINVALSVNLQGSNALNINPLITNALENSGPPLTSSMTNALAATLAIPNGTGVFNANGLLNTNLISVLNTNVSGITLLVTNVLEVQAAIVNQAQSWSAVASSADGTHLAASVNSGLVYTNFAVNTNGDPVYSAGLIYTSTNSGLTWAATGAPNTNWTAVAISADGTHLAAVAAGGLLYSSADGGSTWVAANVPGLDWSAIALSAAGNVQAAVSDGGPIYYDGQEVAPPPAPQITSVQSAGDAVTVFFTTVSGATYRLYSTNAAGLIVPLTNWPSSSSLTGDGGTDHLTDTVSNANRFYRVGAQY